MKSLAIVLAVTLAAAATGCKHCSTRQPACRPCVPASPCMPVASPCGGTTVEAYSSPEIYSAPGTVVGPTTTTPTLSVPSQSIPGPEAYVPAN